MDREKTDEQQKWMENERKMAERAEIDLW